MRDRALRLSRAHASDCYGRDHEHDQCRETTAAVRAHRLQQRPPRAEQCRFDALYRCGRPLSGKLLPREYSPIYLAEATSSRRRTTISISTTWMVRTSSCARSPHRTTFQSAGFAVRRPRSPCGARASHVDPFPWASIPTDRWAHRPEAVTPPLNRILATSTSGGSAHAQSIDRAGRARPPGALERRLPDLTTLQQSNPDNSPPRRRTPRSTRSYS